MKASDQVSTEAKASAALARFAALVKVRNDEIDAAVARVMAKHSAGLVAAMAEHIRLVRLAAGE